MFELTLAVISYADIAFFAVLAVGLILGIIGGAARSAKGLFMSITIILLSLLLVGASINGIKGLSFIQNMTASLTEKSSSWGEVFTEPIHIAEDGSYFMNVEIDGEVRQIPLDEAAGSGLVSKTRGKLALWLAKRFIHEDGQSLNGVAADFIVSIVVAIVMFIIYCVALGIIMWLFRKIFRRMHKSESVTLRIVDRSFGAIIGAALTIITMLLVLAILKSLRNTLPTVDEYLTNSPVCGYLYLHNPLAQVLSKIFG